MKLFPFRYAFLFALSIAVSAQTTPTGQGGLFGFRRSEEARERSLEARFDSNLNKDEMREWMKRLSLRPHHLGSAYDKENSEFIASQFRAWGYQTEIERFDVLFPTPKTRVLELVKPEHFTAQLFEPPIPEDSTSQLASEALPVYNAYSRDGDVTGELVYVNYGVPADYETLAERGISVKGKIAIARYGRSWRGIKPKVAAEHGAIGCIIYSDPRDDGYFNGDVYPRGAWRNERGAQRGSVADVTLYSGDPLTPGIGATKDAKRLQLKDVQTITHIPVLPISYSDALPLLKAIEGPVVPPEWRGALPITYHFGPGPATVHLKVEFNWDMVPAYDVIARIPGSELPDEWIVRGNHYDAWVMGAQDPLSGAVTLMAEAKSTGELLKTGWKPRRTLIYAVWDGEEPGLIGSTEWAETHAEELKKHCAVYINTDTNSRGFVDVSGSHTLEKFVNGVIRDVTDPEKHISVSDRLRARIILRGNAEDRNAARSGGDLHIGALGSGSDYTPFLQHLGIAAMNIEYQGEDGGGSYHSLYDSFDHFTRFVDPSFDYGQALAQTIGRVTLRLCDAEVLPFDFTDFARVINTYIDQLGKLTDDMRLQTEERNRNVRDNLFNEASDPTQTFTPPGEQGPVPRLDFAPLKKAQARLETSAGNYDRALVRFFNDKRAPGPKKISSLDQILIASERAMTRDEGLPKRPWYKHQIYAPGYYTGYEVKTLPGLREAIEQRDWTEAARQIQIISEVLGHVAEEADRAAGMIKKAS